MRFILIILLVFLSGCTLLDSQEIDKEVKKEQEFQDLMKKSKEIQAASRSAIKIADMKADSVIIKTNQKIITLNSQKRFVPSILIKWY